MKSIIVGTAGHIDHGKTALVKALTGIDADRLEEEKRRGITIDIGFAHFELPAANGETVRMGFIDVPGHERFIRNMLAGIGGVDLVLLVIAADESIKPQTREHLAICKLLAIPRGITILTKCDLVDKETLDIVRLEVEDFLRGSFMELHRSPIVEVSARTGAGMEELKRELVRVAEAVPPRIATAYTRFPIDRVFSMKGFGTVITGTLISGSIRPDDELEIFPGQKQVRVRGLQIHGQAEEKAVAGERTAVNLAGVSVEDLKRGMVAASPATFQPANRLDVFLSLLPAAKALNHRARVRLHAYTMEAAAEIFLYKKKQLAPGGHSFAQVRFSPPTLLLPGDRFILRQLSPAITIGGGIVLDNAPPVRIKSEAAHCEWLEILQSGSKADVLGARVSSAGTSGMKLTDAVARTGWTIHDIASTAATIPEIKNIGGLLIATRALEKLKEAIISSLDIFHRQNPMVPGISREDLRARLPRHSPAAFDKALAESLISKQIEIAEEFIRLPGQGIVMKSEEKESQQIIESAFSSAGLKVPALKNVLEGLKIDKVRAQKIVTLLLRDRKLLKVSDELVFHATALESLRQLLAVEKIKSPKMDVARFKALTGVSRKYAIPLLEYLDRERVTRRAGDERIIL